MLEGKKTYIGIIVALAPTLASLLGYDLGETFKTEFAETAEEFLTLVGALIALYGRAKAKSPGWIAKRSS